MERFNGLCTGHLSIIQPEDVFLRLPCDAQSFEAQAEVQNPFFDVSAAPVKDINRSVGSMAYLINVSTIWGDVMANIYRTSQRSEPSNNATFKLFYDQSQLRLHQWKDSLPQCYQFSAENMKSALDSGILGIYMTMHTVYHTASMKLNRYIQRSILTAAQLHHHVTIAKLHAEDVLSMMDVFVGCRSINSPANVNKTLSGQVKLSSSFLGYAIVSAVDILTANFKLATIPSVLASFRGSKTVLAELATFWQSARDQQALVLQRIEDLAGLTAEPASALGFKSINQSAARDTADGTYEMREAIEKTYSRNCDCFYS